MQDASSVQEKTCWEVGGEDVCLVSKGLGSPPKHLHLLGSLPHLHILHNTIGAEEGEAGGERGCQGCAWAQAVLGLWYT